MAFEPIRNEAIKQNHVGYGRKINIFGAHAESVRRDEGNLNSMFSGSLVIGVTLLCFAFWLHWNERHGWEHESLDGDLDHHYLRTRMRSRRWVHALFAVCGVMVIVAAFAGPGRVWIGCWMSVVVGLFTIIILAGADAFRTLRYQAKKKSELRKYRIDPDE